MAAPAGRASNLRDELTFPSFEDCPDERLLDRRYLQPVGGNSPMAAPVRHWCFLGEIVSVDAFLRLVLEVKDTEGERCRVALYTDDKGMSLVPTCKKGYTVAILYANQHGFADGSYGFRVEESTSIKVCHRPS